MTRAVLLDAMGTLVALEPPAPLLRAELAARHPGVEPPSEEEAATAMRAEIAFYRRSMLAGPVGWLRREAAAVLRAALPPRFAGLDLEAALLASLRFTPYPEVPEVLRRLRADGRRIVVVSNWDASLPEVLDRCGLAPMVDDVVPSGRLGIAKPDPRIFEAALGDVPPGEAVHVGDDPEADVAGARAAGLRAVLVDRRPVPVPGAIASLDALPPMLG